MCKPEVEMSIVFISPKSCVVKGGDLFRVTYK